MKTTYNVFSPDALVGKAEKAAGRPARTLCSSTVHSRLISGLLDRQKMEVSCCRGLLECQRSESQEFLALHFVAPSRSLL